MASLTAFTPAVAAKSAIANRRTFAQRTTTRTVRNTQARAAIMYPDVEYIDAVNADFPDKGIASSEEARALVDCGYVILDVRSKAELEAIGQYPRDQINGKYFKHIPIINCVRKYDAELQTKTYQDQEPNREFKAMVEKIFPDKSAKIVVSCSDGRNRAIQALEALDSMGYANIVGLRGGYNMWNRVWDAKMRRRNLPGVFKEEYGHVADGCGVHATGASFENQDAFAYPDWKDTTNWIDV